MKRLCFLLNLVLILFSVPVTAQNNTSDSILAQATLDDCIKYALRRNPGIQQTQIDQRITETVIREGLSDWFPQINLNYNYQHNFQLPVSVFQGDVVRIGIDNTSAIQFGLTQTIFNRDVLLASRTAKDLRTQAVQNTASYKIDVVVDVSKAFYNLLLSLQQIRIINQNIVRLQRSQKDAFYQYESGLVDKTDYKRATISLNNSKAQLKSSEEAVKVSYTYLKQLMDYPESDSLRLSYDTTSLNSEIFVDTLQTVNYANRIEYQQLENQRKLQQANLQYNRWAYLPSLSAFGNYNLNYQNNDFGKLYRSEFPASNAGITLAVPLFQGLRRVQLIRRAELELKRVDLDVVNLRNSVSSEYVTAIAAYKSNFASYIALAENLALATEVYDVIDLQYRSGIKTYLEVITAQSDLFTSQINYYNALYQLLISKVDVNRALGTVKYNYDQ